MRILITGANGFIAREIIAYVHSKLLKSLSHLHHFKMNFKTPPAVSQWMPHLKDIDAVINCVGVFQTATEKTMWNLHYEAPKALFDACVQANVKKVIQISALGINKTNTPYAASKLAADDYLQTLDISSAIIRPSLVYAKGSYGGTSLLRGLAGLPFILPLPGKADQLQQPIYMDDLTLIVEKTLILPGKQLLHAAGSEKLSLKNVLIHLRNWLGFPKTYLISIPILFLKLGAILGRFIPNSPIGKTGIEMMKVPLTISDSEEKNLHEITHIKPRSFTEGLNSMVSSVQDR